MKVFAFLACMICCASLCDASSWISQNDQPTTSPYSGLSYIDCAVQAAHDMISSDQRPRAELYGAYCDMKLGYRLYAAQLIKNVHSLDISEEDAPVLDELRIDLQPEIDFLRPVSGWVLPYAGYLNYSPKTEKDYANVDGVYGGISSGNWGLSVGGEKFHLDEVAGNPVYSQQLVNVALSKYFSPIWSAKVFATDINSGYSAVSERTYGAGIGASPSTATRFNADLSWSVYPSLLQSPVSAGVGTVSWTQRLLTIGGYAVESRLLSETVLIDAAQRTDPTTGFTLAKSYERGALDITVRTERIETGVSGWMGAEALGVRDSGAIVYNILQTNLGGYSAHVQYRWSAAFALRATVSREDYEIVNGISHATGVVVGIVNYF